MAVKKKTPSTVGMSKKMLKRKKPINSNYFLDVGPITENQELFFNEWKDANPDWDKDWSKGCASAGEVGDWRDKMSKTHPGWKDVMSGVKKHPGYGKSTLHKDGYQW